MIFTDFFVTILVGVIIVYTFSRTFGTKGPWGSFLSFLLVVVLFAWTAAVWLKPYGPLWMGISWIPIVFGGFFAAVLLTSVSPRRAPIFYKFKKKSKATENPKADLDVYFWILIFCLTMLIASHFFWFPQFGRQ